MLHPPADPTRAANGTEDLCVASFFCPSRAPTLSPVVAHFDDADQFISLFSNSWEGTIPALFAFDAAGKLQKSLIGEVDPRTVDGLLAKLAPSAVPSRSSGDHL